MEAKKVVWLAVATWLCWSPMFLLGYDTFRFSTIDATRESYSEFIEALRVRLRDSFVEGIPMARASAPDSQRFILIELSNEDGTVTLAMDVISLYIVGYRVGSLSYFFPDEFEPANSNLFLDTQHVRIAYDSSYGALTTAAGAGRLQIVLGLPRLNQAITSLCLRDVEYSEKARYLVGFVEMISEAVRFRSMEELMRASIRRYVPFTPRQGILDFENNWASISTRVRNSRNGVLEPAVEITNSTGSNMRVDNVDRIRPFLGIMKFSDINKQRPQFYYFRDSIIIMKNISVGNEDSYGNYEDDDEPRARIMGPNGLCVQVQPGGLSEGRYYNGSPIQLLPCDPSGKSENQFWTFKRDGTVRSRDMCMATYGFSPDSYVMIYDCNTIAKDASIWKVREDGTIVNPASSLALTAVAAPWDDAATLTVQTNIFDFHQAWLATNSLEPFYESIVGNDGDMDLCMEANIEEDSISLRECDDKPAQRWARYADGSIRPQLKETSCLSYNDLEDRSIILISCAFGSSSQRWMFKNDGTILNLRSNLALQALPQNPRYRNKQITVAAPDPDIPEQKWISMI